MPMDVETAGPKVAANGNNLNSFTSPTPGRANPGGYPGLRPTLQMWFPDREEKARADESPMPAVCGTVDFEASAMCVGKERTKEEMVAAALPRVTLAETSTLAKQSCMSSSGEVTMRKEQNERELG